ANGTAVITVTANDSQSANNTATRTFTVTVTAVNDAPVLDAISDPSAILEDAAEQTITVTGVGPGGGSDESGQSVTVTATSGNTALIASVAVSGTGASRSLKYTPVKDAYGTAVITVTANDSQSANNTATRTFTVTVTSVNDPPVAKSAEYTTREDTAFMIVFEATDADGDTLTYTIVDAPKRGMLSRTAPNMIYTPNRQPKIAFSGTDTFTFKVNDGREDSAPGTVTINITAVNSAPVIRAIAEDKVEHGGSVVITIPVTDADNDATTLDIDDPLTISLVTHPTGGGVDFNHDKKTLTYKANVGFTGTERFSIHASDGQDLSNTAEVVIVVAPPPNRAPVAKAIGPFEAVAGAPMVLDLAGTDADSDPLTASITTSPASGTASVEGLKATFTAPSDFAGSVTFAYAVNDGKASSEPVSVTVAVRAAPKAEGQSVVVTAGEAKEIRLVGSIGRAGDPVMVLRSEPTHGSVKLMGSTATYTPAEGYAGPDEFGFAVLDGTVSSATAVVKVAVNRRPTATAQRVETPQDKKATISLTVSDDGALTALKVTVKTQPANGSVAVEGLSADYAPKAGFFGEDSFVYVATDEHGASSAETTVQIVVTRVNAQPVFVAMPRQEFLEGSDLVARLSATDADADAVRFALVRVEELTPRGAGDGDLALTVDANGTLRARLVGMSRAERDFVVIVSIADGVTDPVTATVALRVNALPPSTAPASLTARALERGVRLTWSADPAAARYDVYRSNLPIKTLSGIAPLLSNVAGTTADDPDAPVGATIYYAVVTVNAIGLRDPRVFSPVATIALAGPSGATVSVGDRITVKVPPEGITIARAVGLNAAEELLLAPERSQKIGGVVRDFGVTINADTSDGNTVGEFAKPVAVSIRLFEDTKLSSPTIRVGRATERGWEVVVIRTDTVANTLTFDAKKPGLYQGIQLPAVPWNVSTDGVIDIQDLVRAASTFGESEVLTPEDINGDGVIDIADLVMVATHFGESVSSAPTWEPASVPVRARLRFEASHLDGDRVEVRLVDDSGSGISGYAARVAFSVHGVTLEQAAVEQPTFGFSSVRSGERSVELLAARLGAEPSADSHTLARFHLRLASGLNPDAVVRSIRLSDVQLVDGSGRRVGYVMAGEVVASRRTALLPNFPNPFNPETWIPFELKEGSAVTVTIHDTTGALVRKLDLGYREPGYYTSRSEAAYWDGRNELGERVASGVYFYELRAGSYQQTRRMVIDK
ncbi:tandem-95 repeat protein, partial [Candidatus Poribacteria bacterium]|nr:tandem-95 repeat protein [Candidatus Poribacteria bacterium]